MSKRMIPAIMVFLVSGYASADPFPCQTILSFEIVQGGEIIAKPVLKIDETSHISVAVRDSDKKAQGLFLEVDVSTVDAESYRVRQSWTIADEKMSFTSRLDLDSDPAVVESDGYSITAQLLSCDDTSRFRF